MEMALKALLAGFWLLLIPPAAGVVFLKKKENLTFSECFMAGYLFLFALMEILVLPMIYCKVSLHVLVAVYGTLLVLAAAAGLVFLKKSLLKSFRQWAGGLSPWFWAAAVVIALQIVTAALTAHFDADDAMYVGAASTAVQTDTIYSVNPYTGYDYVTLPSRYVLSPFPVFLAVISRLCAGLHPAITAHVIFPAVFLFMAYMVQYMLGKLWFEKNPGGQGMFLFSVAILNWFSAYSVYNAGNFQMIRIWQGKALLASTLLPYVFYLCFRLMIRQERKVSWLLLGMAVISCCLVSSMGIMLAPLEIGLLTLTGLVCRKKLSYLYKAALCCIPSMILGAVYIFIK